MSTNDQIALDRRLQETEDRHAISGLIARLGQMLDDKRFDDAPSILADDVSVQTGGGSAQGREAVVAQASRTHTVTTQHMLTDVAIDLDGDHAQARANAIITFAPDGSGHRLTINDAEQAEPVPDARRGLPPRRPPHGGRLAHHPDRGQAKLEHEGAGRTRNGRAGEWRGVTGDWVSPLPASATRTAQAPRPARSSCCARIPSATRTAPRQRPAKCRKRSLGHRSRPPPRTPCSPKAGVSHRHTLAQ